MVTGKNHDRLLLEAVVAEGGHHLANLRIHVSDRGIIATDRLLLAADIHLHVHAGLVVDASLGNIIPIPRHFPRQLHRAVGQERGVVRNWSNKGDVWPDKSNAQPESLMLVLFDQLHRLGRCPAIGMDQVISVRLDNDKRVPADHRFFSVRVSLQRLSLSRCLPLRPLAVELLSPRSRVIGSICSFLDASRYSHVIDLADPRRVVAGILEML